MSAFFCAHIVHQTIFNPRNSSHLFSQKDISAWSELIKHLKIILKMNNSLTISRAILPTPTINCWCSGVVSSGDRLFLGADDFDC